jgi:hypothetical protein
MVEELNATKIYRFSKTQNTKIKEILQKAKLWKNGSMHYF